MPAGVTVARLAGGLINQTFLISGPTSPVSGDGAAPTAPQRFVLQQISPLFSPAIHQNVFAVTVAVQRAGLITPLIVPTVDEELFLRLPTGGGGPADSVWRLMTYVPGASFDVLASTAQAQAAGQMVARFHGAVDSLRQTYTFVGLRANVHDTARHLRHLRQTLADHPDHRLSSRVTPLAKDILDAAAALPDLPALAPRICHGDLKLNNFLFAGSTTPLRDEAVCLIDLDTVGPQPLAFEMGDAWRSWCNRNGENSEIAAFDLSLFEASLDGYRAGLGRPLYNEERRALLLGPEWISLELSARFAADALAESYFGWDSDSYPGRGEHNLVRARGQFSMYQALLASRPRRSALLGASTDC